MDNTPKQQYRMNMKNITGIMAAAAAAVLLSACGKEGPAGGGGESGAGSPLGSWHMESWTAMTAADIYVAFDDDGTFDLYQKLYTPYYEHLDGTWEYSRGVLGGEYSDGEPWRSEYRLSFSNEGGNMTMTAVSDAADAARYVKEDIPDSIISGDLSMKSHGGDPGFRAL